MTILRYGLQAIFLLICCLVLIALPVLLMPVKINYLQNFLVPTIQISTFVNFLAYVFTLIMIYRFDRFAGNQKNKQFNQYVVGYLYFFDVGHFSISSALFH